MRTGKTALIRLRACFLEPGVFDLNAFRVTMMTPSTSAHSTSGTGGANAAAPASSVSASFTFPSQHLVGIEDAAAGGAASAATSHSSGPDLLGLGF